MEYLQMREDVKGILKEMFARVKHVDEDTALTFFADYLRRAWTAGFLHHASLSEGKDKVDDKNEHD